MIKISKGEYWSSDDDATPFLYGRIYEDENNRLKIASDTNQVDLLLDLIDCLNPSYYVLYVLIVSRLDNELGRYQSPLFESKEELADFLNEFKSYIETDARHHIWIGTLDNSGLLIYDQHNVIYAYGNIDQYKTVLNKNQYKMQSFGFPVPHIHYYHKENDESEKEILRVLDWGIFPLEDGDMY